MVAREAFKAASPGDQNAQIVALGDAELEKAKESGQAAQLVAWAESQLARCRQARMPEERKWLKNIDMFEGRQYTHFVAHAQKPGMAPIPQRPNEPQVTVNIIEPRIRTLTSKTGSSHPSATIAPASTDGDDIATAEAAQSVWEWWESVTDFYSKQFGQANYWNSVTGQGFIKTWFDLSEEDEAATQAASAKHREDLKAFTPTIEPGAMPTPPPLPPQPVMGKIMPRSVSPFHIYVPDLSEPDLQEQPYLFHLYTMTKDRAKIVYANFTPDDWDPPTMSGMEEVQLNERPTQQTQSTSRPEMVVVKELWVKPKQIKALPLGGVMIYIGTEVVSLKTDGLPYDHGKYPFAHMYGIETGRFYRRSLIRSLIPLQSMLNRSWSMIQVAKNTLIRNAFFYDEGSIDVKRISTAAGGMIPVRLGYKAPTAVPVRDLPLYVTQESDKIMTIIDDVTGQHQVTRAIAPGADTAASAIATLQEKDDDFIAPTLTSIDTLFKDTATFVLSLAVQFWDEPRLIKIAGTENAYDVKMLTGADIAGGTDVRIEPESGLPSSKAGKIATITDWMARGFIPPEVGLRAINTGALLGKIKKELDADRAQAERENLQIQKLDPAEVAAAMAPPALPGMDPAADPAAGGNPFAGVEDPAIGLDPAASAPPASDVQAEADPTGVSQPIAPMAPDPASMSPAFPVNDWDNDAIHLEVHGRFLKSQAYQKLDPALQQVAADHWRAHNARFTMAQQAQAAAQVSPAGADAPGDSYAGGQPA